MDVFFMDSLHLFQETVDTNLFEQDMYCIYTVDERNPAPPGMYKAL